MLIQANTSSNEYWESAANFEDFETNRPLLFRDDMREQFFRWFRIKPTDQVLDGGCAAGVLTRFIAKGLTTGFITGFDISQTFVDNGNQKIKEEGLSSKAKIVKEDGFALSFADNTFDAVINHTYIGVLSDVMAGIKELIRVCKPGGHISASASARNFPSIQWAGDSMFTGETRLSELRDKHETAFRKTHTTTTLKQDDYWHVLRYPRLFAKCGLKNITIHPNASGFSYNDSYWTDEFKKSMASAGGGREIEKYDPDMRAHGFTPDDFNELNALYRQKRDFLLSSASDDDSWGWNANMHLIVTGTKE